MGEQNPSTYVDEPAFMANQRFKRTHEQNALSVEPASPQIDYIALKECMKDAIKEALLYERKRRERAIGMYMVFMGIFGALLLMSLATSPNANASIQTTSIVVLISILGLAATQFIFSIWALTRWI